jgi:hypothetical protein
VQNGGRIGKGYQTNSGFSAGWTTHRFVRNAARLKLHGAAAALENRTGCFDITFSAIIPVSCGPLLPFRVIAIGSMSISISQFLRGLDSKVY